jgi:hypothetical protein
MVPRLKVHGRLLGAAIEAQRPVQICVICYVNQQGELDLIAPFIGEMTFAEHVLASVGNAKSDCAFTDVTCDTCRRSYG